MREIPLYPPIKEGEIILSYSDSLGETTKVFRNVNELAAFFKENPAIARYFGYISKNSPQPVQPKPVNLVDSLIEKTMRRFFNEGVLTGYDDEGVHLCACNFLIEKISLGWAKTELGKKYLEKLKK